MAPSLDPITPEEAIDWYLEHRQDELREATQRTHKSALDIFHEWADEADLTNLNNLRGRDLVAFKTWRKKEADIKAISLNGTLASVRRFLRFCERIEAVEEGLTEKLPLPNVPPDEEVREDAPEDEAVRAIRMYCDEFQYATRQHVIFELIAEVGIRLGAVRAIDLEDVDLQGQVIHLRDRPGEAEVSGTSLKNKSDGERIINISPDLMKLLRAYIDRNRYDVTGKCGRNPLFTTRKGRVSKSTVRRDIYQVSRPCVYDLDCPHGRDEATCEATTNKEASKCPSVFSTHPLRKWAIMSQLDAGISRELLSDRVDVSVPVLDKHYDQRSEQRKSRRRREELEAHLDQYAMTDGGQSIDDDQ